MRNATAPLDVTYAIFEEHLEALNRLDAQFGRLAGAMRRLLAADHPDREVRRFDAPSGQRIRLDLDARWPTVWLFDTHRDRQVPPTAGEVGFCRLWRPPADLLSAADRLILADPPIAAPPAPVLPQRWDPAEGWRDPEARSLRRLTLALRWAHYRLLVDASRAA